MDKMIERNLKSIERNIAKIKWSLYVFMVIVASTILFCAFYPLDKDTACKLCNSADDEQGIYLS